MLRPLPRLTKPDRSYVRFFKTVFLKVSTDDSVWETTNAGSPA